MSKCHLCENTITVAYTKTTNQSLCVDHALSLEQDYRSKLDAYNRAMTIVGRAKELVGEQK